MANKELRSLHNKLLYETIAIEHFSAEINNGNNLRRFRANCRNYLTSVEMASRDCEWLLEELERKGYIKVGEYGILKEIVQFSTPLVEQINDVERDLNRKRNARFEVEPASMDGFVRINKMSSPRYPPRPEALNLYRLNLVLRGPCTDQLRDVLRRYVPPAVFPQVIQQKKSYLPRLTQPQRELILPSTEHYSGDYSDMDISLLYILLRNMCNINPHSKGWGNKPDDADYSLSACIDRIREVRYYIGHSSDGGLCRMLFVDYWSDIKRSVKVIDSHLSHGDKYEKDVNYLLEEPIDPEREEVYVKQLKQQMESDTSLGQSDKNSHNSFQGIKDLRSQLVTINESEADRIQILPFKTDDTLEFDEIYVPVSIVDEYDTRNGEKDDEETIRSINLDEIFTVQSGRTARFVFMLGEAGYGKTVQCQRIAKSWCEAWKNEEEHRLQHSNLEICLKQFDLLIFVAMREVDEEHVTLTDMIKDAYSRYHLPEESLDDIVRFLKYGHFKSLVVIDGLDEWNISEDKKKFLLDKCIPNCRNMPNSTILISMRSWKFMEVEQICRPKVDRVIRLNGLDERGVKELTENMISNYFRTESISSEYLTQADPQKIQKKYDQLKNIVSSASFEQKSLLQIPLPAIFCILTLYENVETGGSQTTFFLSMIETLMKRYFKRYQPGQVEGATSEGTVNEIFQNYPLVMKQMQQLTAIGKIAFEGLTSKSTNLVFSENQLDKLIGKETIDLILSIGLVIKTEISGKFYEDNVRISFLHKTIQEFLASLYLFTGNDDSGVKEILQKELVDVEKALEYSPVLIFLAGLTPSVGCYISHLIKGLTEKDEDIRIYRVGFHTKSYQKIFNLYNLQLRCYREVRGGISIEAFKKQKENPNFTFSDVILISSDTDELAVRESNDVLKFHASDIISLNMVCISDDDKKGINNTVLKNFLNESQSIESIFIDGYVNGRRRLFDVYSHSLFSLPTLGLANVAFKDNVLADLITKEKSREQIRALGLIYLKSAEDEVVDFQYHIPSIHWKITTKSGFKRSAYPKETFENSASNMQEKTPILRALLEVLPEYKNLSTLHITYMEAEDDRQMFIEVLPKLSQLQDIIYSGSSIYPNPNSGYDAEVISKIMIFKSIHYIEFRNISSTENVLNFEEMSKLKEISLQEFIMVSPHAWMAFVKSLSKIKNLERLCLFNTNIPDEVYDKCKTISCSVHFEKNESADL